MNRLDNEQDFYVLGLDTLPDGWKYSPLGELVDSERGISYGIVQPGSHLTQGVPIVRVNNLQNGQIISDDILKVSSDIEKKYQRTRLRGGEVLLSLVGSLGQTAVVPSKVSGWNVARAIAVIPVIPEIGPEWINFALRSPLLQHYIHTWATTTVQATLNLGDVVRLPIPIPPEKERKAIIDILGALDDKIELNRRMNATLESMARAVFRQWFVEGKDISNWEEKPLDEIANFLNGLALQKFPAEGDDYLPVIKISQLRTNDTEGADKASTNIPPPYIIEDGDILFSWSGSLVVVAWCGGKGALNQHLFKVTSEKYPKWFYYFWTKHHLADFQEIAAGKATTMGHIQRHHLKAAKVLVPSDKELQEMDKFMSPLLQQIIVNNLGSRTLASLRDSLLPKLMRGEVRVKV
jgi:type I restriction enzyme S subunit